MGGDGGGCCREARREERGRSFSSIVDLCKLQVSLKIFLLVISMYGVHAIIESNAKLTSLLSGRRIQTHSNFF